MSNHNSYSMTIQRSQSIQSVDRSTKNQFNFKTLNLQTTSPWQKTILAVRLIAIDLYSKWSLIVKLPKWRNNSQTCWLVRKHHMALIRTFIRRNMECLENNDFLKTGLKVLIPVLTIAPNFRDLEMTTDELQSSPVKYMNKLI